MNTNPHEKVVVEGEEVDVEDIPSLLRKTRVELEEVRTKLSNMRRRKRKKKVDFKLQARDSEASNRTERKAYVHDLREDDPDFQQLLSNIDELSKLQAVLEGQMKWLQTTLKIKTSREAAAV